MASENRHVKRNEVTKTDSCSTDSDLPVGERVELSARSGKLSRVVLSGRFVSLVPLDLERDVQDLYTASHGSEEHLRLWTYMGYGPFSDVDVMKQWLEEQAASRDPLFLAVVDKASDRRIGMVSFLNDVPDMRRIELGHIWYSPAYQRTVVNTEAVYLMMCYAFEQLDYHRVEWKCDALNVKSRRAALRLGFTFEGVFRKHMIVKGRNRDTAWYAMTDDEWPLVKKNIETWLYEEGLDAFTKRRMSLSELNANVRSESSRRAATERED